MRRRWFVIITVVLLLTGLGLCRLHTAAPRPQDGTRNAADLGLLLLDSAEGVSVLAVQEGSTAERAGIYPSDLLLQVNGTTFTTIDELEALLRDADESVLRLQLLRTGDGIELRIPLER